MSVIQDEPVLGVKHFIAHEGSTGLKAAKSTVLCQCLVISVIELNGSDYFTPFVIIGYNITIQSRIQSTNNRPWVNYLPIFGADSMKQNQWLGHMELMTS